ncbi:MAG: FHA domain-containing protein [Myxococcota bacterium]
MAGKALKTYRTSSTGDLARFRREYGNAFLVLHGALETDDRLLRTAAIESGSELPNVAHDMSAFEIRSTGRGSFPGFVSVGRVNNNDIVIEHSSLSKFHAYFRDNGESGFGLHDAGSMNGTFVDEQEIPKRDGKPWPLRSGHRIRFGAVGVTYLEASEFVLLVRKLA